MQGNLPPLAALRSFVAVTKHGSVGAAAEELHVTHGAVSHQIYALEKYTGVQLIERKGRRTHVTEAGRVYAYQVRQSLENIASATKRVKLQNNGHEIRVSVLPSFAMYWLMPRLPSWLQTHPGLKLHFDLSMSFVDLQSSVIDCAVRFGSGMWPDVTARRFLGDSLLLVAAPGLFAPGTVSVAEALRKPILHSSESWALWLSASGERHASSPLSMIEFTDSTHLIEAVRRGMGVALTRRSLAQELLDTGALVQVTDIEIDHPSSYFLVWPHRVRSAGKIERLLEWLLHEAHEVGTIYSRSHQGTAE